MARNVIYEIAFIYSRLIDEGTYTSLSGEVVPYREETLVSFMRLADFIAKGSFVSTKSRQFIRRNYLTIQAELPALWSAYYPNEKEISAANFRVQSQQVNKVLEQMLPDDLVDAYVNENTKRIREIESIVNALKSCDRHIEAEFGAFLDGVLAEIPSTYKKFELDDCEHELRFLARMSQATLDRERASCNKEKLAYLFSVLRKPALVSGVVNKQRLEVVNRYLTIMNSMKAGTLSEVTEPVSVSAEPVTTESVITNEDAESAPVSTEPESTSILASDVQRAIEGYISGEQPTDDTLINPEIISAIASVSVARFVKSLAEFPRDEVAYVLQELLNGNEYVHRVYKECIERGTVSMLGDYMFLPTVLEKVESCIEGVEPSDDADPAVAQVLADYLVDNAVERLETLDPCSLARGVHDLKAGGVTAQLVDKFSEGDMVEYENMRLSLKSEKLSSEGT